MSSNPRRFLPPLSALLAFEHAGVQLSFKRAASSLALSPSAVSHQIRNLEDRLGVQLFARREGATRLTEAGERYLEAVSAALKTIESATSAILQERRDFRSELRVSAPPLFTSTVLMPALGDLEAFGVLAKLHLETFRGQGDFESSGVDVAIRLGREQCVGLRLNPLLETHRLPVCAPSLAHGCQSLMDLERQALIHVETQPHAWSRWLADMGEPGLRGARDVWVDSEPAA
ncbi:MAG TPA: LysR family transcriptional regulator, partial [Phenylobacterium sp.]|nr:LysR family transcriptional regulator [Phenylobacterium sp.]